MPRFRSYRAQCCVLLLALLAGANLAEAGGASITLQPVPPKTVPPSDYPPGTTIVGQEIILGSVPARVWLEIHVTGWAPECLKAVQATIDATDTSNMDGGGYAGSAADCMGQPGNGGTLGTARAPCNGRCNANSGPLAGIDCLTNAECGNPPGNGQCQFTFPAAPNGNINCRNAISGLATACGNGEPSTCQGSGTDAAFCSPYFQDLCDPQWIAANLVSFPAIDVSSYYDPRYGTAVDPGNCLIDFSPSYIGTLVLDVPASAKGIYTIDFIEGISFLQNHSDPPGNDIPVSNFFAARITVPCGRCCSGYESGQLDCVDHVTEMECSDPEEQAFTADTLCLENGGAECPQCGSDVHCDDGVFCNGAEICNSVSGCVDGAIPCDPNLCDEEANECRPGIPTVNEWGFVVLACLLLIAAKLRYRRMAVVILAR